MKVIILWGSRHSQNRGVNAITEGLLDLLKDCGIDPQVIIIGSAQDKKKIEDGYLLMPIPNLIELSVIYVKSFFGIFPEWYDKRESYLVLDTSEGDSFTDIYGWQRFLTQVISKLSFQRLSDKYVLVPQTFGPFHSTFSKIIARIPLVKVDESYFRDEKSVELFHKMSRKNVEFSYDLAFAMRPIQPSLVTEYGKNAIGLNINGLLWKGGYSGKNEFGLAIDYRELTIRLVNSLLESGYNVVLVPHTYGGGTIENDMDASRELMDILHKDERITLMDQPLSAREVKWNISHLTFFIGSRLHSCIAALSSGVPTIGLSYSVKFKGVFESVGIKNHAIELRERTIDEIIEEIKILIPERIETRKILESKTKMIDQSQKELVKQIMRL